MDCNIWLGIIMPRVDKNKLLFYDLMCALGRFSKLSSCRFFYDVCYSILANLDQYFSLLETLLLFGHFLGLLLNILGVWYSSLFWRFWLIFLTISETIAVYIRISFNLLLVIMKIFPIFLPFLAPQLSASRRSFNPLFFVQFLFFLTVQ